MKLKLLLLKLDMKIYMANMIDRQLLINFVKISLKTITSLMVSGKNLLSMDNSWSSLTKLLLKSTPITLVLNFKNSLDRPSQNSHQKKLSLSSYSALTRLTLLLNLTLTVKLLLDKASLT